MNYDNKEVLLPISGGINSAAVLCWLAESGQVPSALHLFYIHLSEHSADTFPFVKALIRFARDKFPNVIVKIKRDSALKWFRDHNMIPHPKNGGCSFDLKIKPMNLYAFENDLKIDLVGYVKHELNRRVKRQKKAIQSDLFSLQKTYPIGEFTDDWCFEIVVRNIGWYPRIYDIKDADGNRLVFASKNLSNR